MWDVIWTDPDRELVGEHRAKKDQKRAAAKGEKDGAHASSKSSASTRSSLSSADSPLAFLRSQHSGEPSKGREKPGSAKVGRIWRSGSWSKASSAASSALGTLSNPSARSPLSPTFDIRSRRSSTITATNDSSLHSRPSVASRSPKEASQSDTEHNNLPNDFATSHQCAKEALREILAVCKAIDEQDPMRIQQDALAGHPSSSDQAGPPAGHDDTNDNVTVAPLKTTRYGDNVNVVSLASTDPSRNASNTAPSEDELEPPTVPPKSPLRASLRLNALPAVPNNASAWLPSEAWEGSASKADAFYRLKDDEVTYKEVIAQLQQLDASNMNEKLMAANLGSVITELRLNGAESAETRDLLALRKLWMLAALHLFDMERSSDEDEGIRFEIRNSKNVLLLFDCSGSAFYLAARFAEKQLYHVARHPLRDLSFSNLTPLALSDLSPQLLQLIMPSDLDVISSRAITSLIPPSELKRYLECLRSHLRPDRGTLHLTLVDALPHAATLGPKLSSWVERHLLPGLRKTHISPTPSRVYPKYLSLANLRGQGSRRVKTKFFATHSNIRGKTQYAEEPAHQDHDPDPAIRMLRAEMLTKAELRCLIGRMLWMEIWGPHVATKAQIEDAEVKSGFTWWWDDEEIMNECERMCTFWEYHVIDAVRGP